MRADIDAIAADLSRRQHGVFARWQLGDSDAIRKLAARRVEARRWESVAGGVLRLWGTRPSWRQRVMIRCLVWGEGAVASHAAAAALWSLAGFDEGPVEITIPRGRARANGFGRVHTARLPPGEIAVRDGIPVTTPARTLLDLAGAAESLRLEGALDDALRRRLTSLRELHVLADRHPGRRGVGILRALVRERAGIAISDSRFETLLRRALIDADLPPFTAQHPIRIGGEVVAVPDFVFVPQRVVVEADSYRFHEGRARFDHDRRRRNRLTLDGWLVIHVTWADFRRDRGAVIEAIRQAIAMRAER